MSKSEKILLMLKDIPKGKVTTYGALARAAKSSPRAVGQIMRRNPWPETCPCYKVIKSDGTIGGFDGQVRGKKISDKIAKLRGDGIEIKDGKIDLDRFLHKF
jgi:methylated-DNA-[protein]-cysteine S-methyltransferase